VAGLLAPLDDEAEGQRSLRAQVLFTQNKLPRDLTERGLVDFFRRHQAKRLAETTEATLEERKWHTEMLVAFSRPPGDLEFHVLWYDVGADGRQPQRFVADMSTFVSNRNEKTFVQRAKLPRQRGFRPNKYYKAIITVQRAEVGSATIALMGEEPQRSGRVDFSDSEAR
jgi:hypothetical protein